MFPTIVYRIPGPHVAPRGTYDYRGASDQAEYDAAIADGWHPTLMEAMSPASAVVRQLVEAQDAIDDISPATRDELEQQARKLDIPFNARTKDEVLASRIAEALQ